MDPWKIFYGLPAQSLDLNCNLFMTFLSFAQNSFYDTNAVERNLSFCHKLVPNASVHNIQAVWGCVVHSVYIVQHNAYNAGVWIRGPGTRKQIRDGSSTLELQQWSPKVACLCVNVKLFVYKLHYNALHVFVLHWIRGFELLAAKIETLVRPLVRYSHHIQCLFAPLYVFCLFWCCCWQLLFLIVFLIVWVVGRLEPLGRPRVRDSHQFHCPHTRWCELHKALVNHSATAMIQKWDPKGIPMHLGIALLGGRGGWGV